MDRGQAVWLAARGMGVPPATVAAGLDRSDPNAVFAVTAAAEAYGRENQRWETLLESLSDLFDAYLGG